MFGLIILQWGWFTDIPYVMSTHEVASTVAPSIFGYGRKITIIIYL